MTQEDKDLLLRDLSARLPYKVKINVNGEEDILLELGVDTGWVNASYNIDDVKPYLRSMVDMTEEERHTFDTMTRGYTIHQQTALFDWLNAHHFDYRGLIEIGLAIEVTEEHNPYKK